MVGLAVGIDYALFIVSRHREQLTEPGQDVEDSIARAIATAGSAVVFAGSTVIIALAALAAAGIPFLTVMGLAAAGTVAVAVLVATTLVPAVLGFAGERLRPAAKHGSPAGSGPPARPARARGSWGLAWARADRPRAGARARGLHRGPGWCSHCPSATCSWACQAMSPSPPPVPSTRAMTCSPRGSGRASTRPWPSSSMPPASRFPSGRRLSPSCAGTLRRDPDIADVAAPVANPAGTIVVLSVVPKTGPDATATSTPGAPDAR